MKPRLLSRLLPPDKQPEVVRFALVFAGIISSWAVLHDLYLIHIEPRHFTVYHRPLLPITNLWLLALQYALVATIGPGLVFGFLAWCAARGGQRQPRALAPVAGGFGLIIIAAEIIILGLGRFSLRRFHSGDGPLYPQWLYPDFTDGIIHTQSVNISAYLVAPALGALYLLVVWLRRPVR
ncbi:MAG: hypothetical protein ABII82_05485 [Verrucomicrobiota bacterium]